MRTVTSRDFGSTPSGEAVTLYTLHDELGQSVEILDFGATIRAIRVLDKSNALVDVALGYDDISGYLNNSGYLGATIGRYANRIAQGRFSLGGKQHHLALNSNGNSLHGGNVGFSHRVWHGEIAGDLLRLSLHSPDGEEGYPGNFDITQTVSFSHGTLTLEYEYQSDRDTIANITNHCYFNLNGPCCPNIHGHIVTINAQRYCESDPDGAMTTPPVPVDGTPFDFRRPKAVGADIESSHPQIAMKNGYDANYELCDNLAAAATALGNESGIELTVRSSYPGMQFYTSNSLETDGLITGKDGVLYHNRKALCFEAQQYPNAINVPFFPDCVLKAGTVAKNYISFSFK